jgi:TPR repeat protein
LTPSFAQAIDINSASEFEQRLKDHYGEESPSFKAIMKELRENPKKASYTPSSDTTEQSFYMNYGLMKLYGIGRPRDITSGVDSFLGMATHTRNQDENLRIANLLMEILEYPDWYADIQINGRDPEAYMVYDIVSNLLVVAQKKPDQDDFNVDLASEAIASLEVFLSDPPTKIGLMEETLYRSFMRFAAVFEQSDPNIYDPDRALIYYLRSSDELHRLQNPASINLIKGLTRYAIDGAREALDTLKTHSKAGNKRARAALGKIYATSSFSGYDITQAIAFYNQALLDIDNPVALSELSMSFEAIDLARLYKSHPEFITHKSVSFLFVVLELSRYFPIEEMNNIKTTLRDWMTSIDDTELAAIKSDADKGNPSAQSILGFLMRSRAETAEDQSEVVDLLRAASKTGNLLALYDLSDFYATGYYVEKDMITSDKYLEEAAQMGGLNALTFFCKKDGYEAVWDKFEFDCEDWEG